MSKYIELRRKPIVPTSKDLKKDMVIVMLEMVSVMCDNVSYLKITKKDENTVAVRYYTDNVALSFSNLQAESNAKELIKWAMLDNDLNEIVRLAGSGTSAVGKIMVRENKK